MKFKQYYLTITLVTIAGILTSIAFFPSKSDTLLMYFYDKQYEKAYLQYKELYENGDRSIFVVIPLVKILLEYAQEDEAIQIMEEYVEEHPQSVDARKLLGKIYLNAQRSYDYLQNLEKIYSMAPSAEVLREREKYYGYVGDTESEIQSLEEILEKYKGIEQEFLELAYRYASKGKTDKALETMGEFLAKYPVEKIDPATAEFAIDLLAAQGKSEEAIQLAFDYQKTHPDLEITLRLVSTLQKAKLCKSGRELLDHLDKEYILHPSVIIAHINLLLEEELPFLAYERLLRHYTSKTLPRTLVKDFLMLAIEYNDMPILEHIVERGTILQLPDSLLIKIIHSAIASQRPDIIETLSIVLNKEYLDEHFPVAMALMLADSNLTHLERSYLSNYYETETLSPGNTILLAEICSEFRYRGVAKKLLSQINSFEGVPYGEQSLLASLLLENGLAEKGWEMVQEAFSGNPDNKETERAWVLLGCGVGETNAILEWIQRQEAINESLLIDAFYIAYENKRASLSMHLANTIFELRPTNRNKQFVGKALLLNGHVEKAYEIFNELLSAGEDVAEPFATTLILLASQDSEYNDRLQEAVNQLLDDETISEVVLRNLGYLLINKKFETQAEATFAHLAKGKLYDNPDTQTLLGLWGAKLGTAEIDWIAKHAKSTQGKEKGKWLQHLLDTEHYDEVVALVDRDEWEEDEIVDIYVKALIMTKEEKTLEEVIAYVIPQEGRLPRLKQYGKIARDEGLTSIATTVYLRILQSSPKDEEALLALGGIYYSNGEYCQAKKFLRNYFRESGDHYLGYYYYGEILLHEKKKKHARDFFRQGLSKIDEPDSYTQSVQAHLLHRLGCTKQAIALYSTLLKENPDNLYLRADFANVLIDIERYRLAKKLLFFGTPQSEDVKAEIALALARVRYLKECHCYKRALCLSKKLMETDQNSAPVLANRADLEFSIGRWRRASRYMDLASCIQPKNESYLKAGKEILLDHQRDISVAGEYRETGDTQKETFYRYHSSACLYPFTLLTVEIERDHLKLDTANDAGAMETDTYDRYRGEIALSHAFPSDHNFISTFYFAPHIFGGRLQTELLDFRGKTFMVFEYHHPNWDFTQTITEHGSRDMVGLSRTHHVIKRLEASLGISYNRYNLKGFENATTSYAIEGQLTYTLWPPNYTVEPFGQYFLVNLNYSLDGEYHTHIRKSKDNFGNPIQPLPFVDREIHTGTLFISKRFFPNLAFEGYGGYNYDATVGGKSLPVYGSNVIFGRKECLESRLTYSHASSTQFSSISVDQFILDINYKW
ncbi:MAG: tetratricopeptide repeat protein [Waddliaceae bacterium]